MRKYELTQEEAELTHMVVAAHCEALKNHVATAVETGKIRYAEDLVYELRRYQTIFAKTNVEAHIQIDKCFQLGA